MSLVQIQNSIYALIFMLLIPFYSLGQIEITPPIHDDLDSIFSVYHSNPGATIGIVSQGEVVFQKGYGLANLENEIAVTNHTVFEAGSVAMHITATAILLLEERGKLSLDDPIQKYLDDFSYYGEDKVTLRHCLHHTSGMRDYLDLLRFSGQSYQIEYSNTDAATLLARQKQLTIPPGSDYRYSNSNYLILALIVEKISGQSLGDFAHENIFAPLGMHQTFFYEDNEKVIKNRALSYRKEGEDFKLIHNFNFTTCGDGRLYSTMDDLLKWATNFDASKIGNDIKFMERLFQRGVLNSGDSISYALGLEHGDFRGHRLIGHNGWWSGNSAMMLHFPDDHLFVITLGNNASMNAMTKCFQASALLLDDNQQELSSKEDNKPTTQYIELSPSDKKQFCGSYFSYEIGYARKVYLQKDTLYYQDGEHEDLPLQPFSKNEFALMNDNNATTIRFETSSNSENDPIMYIQYGERPPMKLLNFEPTDEKSLERYFGTYYSEELGVKYILKDDNGKLSVTIDEKIIANYSPIMKNLFNSAHDGYLQFEENETSIITTFTINDYSLGKLKFFKKE